MDENPSAIAIDHALVLNEILGYVATRRSEAIRRAVASGFREAEIAAALGISLSGVQEALGVDGRGDRSGLPV